MILKKESINHLYQFEEGLVCLPFEKTGLINKASILEAIKYVGSNHKKVLVWVSHSIDDLNSENNILLLNILKAIQLTVDDIILIESTKISIQLLFHVFEFEKCITFGLKAKQIGIQSNCDNYTPFDIYNTTFLMSDSAELLNNHKKHKEKLWMSLKKMFTKPQK